MDEFRIIEFKPIKTKFIIDKNVYPDKKSIINNLDAEIICMLNPYCMININNTSHKDITFIDDDYYINKYPIITNSNYMEYSTNICIRTKNLIVSEEFFRKRNLLNISNFYKENMQYILSWIEKGGKLKLYWNRLDDHCFQEILNKFKSLSLTRDSIISGSSTGHYWIFKNYQRGSIQLPGKFSETTFVNMIRQINDTFILEYQKCYSCLRSNDSSAIHYQKLIQWKQESIAMAKNICFLHNIEIKWEHLDQEYYHLMNNKPKIKTMKHYFPPHPYRDSVKLSIEATYSVSHHQHNIILWEYMMNNDYDVKNMTFIDAMACVGGVSIDMAQWFKQTIAIERDSMNYACLLENIELYKSELTLNINTIKGDCLKILPALIKGLDQCKPHSLYQHDIKNTILFLDPPWGGIGYRSYKYMELWINQYNVMDIIEHFMDQYTLIVLKAPYNHDDRRIIPNDIIKLPKYKLSIFKK